MFDFINYIIRILLGISLGILIPYYVFVKYNTIIKGPDSAEIQKRIFSMDLTTSNFLSGYDKNTSNFLSGYDKNTSNFLSGYDKNTSPNPNPKATNNGSNYNKIALANLCYRLIPYPVLSIGKHI
jgi:hypothetical protein